MTGAKKIVSWNTGGLKDVTRRHQKVEIVRNILEKANETLFVALQETHWTENADVPQLFKILKICIGFVTVMHQKMIIFQE